jgi:hypothetical protein
MYSPFSKEVSSISEAFKIIGADALRHILLGVNIAAVLDNKDDETLNKILFSSEIAKSVCDVRDVENVSISTLLYGIGTLMANKYLPEEMRSIDIKCARGIAREEATLDILGITLPELGAEIAKSWKLPKKIISIIDETGDQDIVNLVKFSNKVSSLIYDGKQKEASGLIESFDLPESQRNKLNSLVVKRTEKLGEVSTVNEITSVDILKDLLFDLSNKKKNANDVAKLILNTIGETLDAKHCLLFMQTKSGEFRVRYYDDRCSTEIKNVFRVSSEYQPNTFHAVLKNNVDIAINDISKLKEDSLPSFYRNLLPEIKKFIVLPISNGSRVSGLLYFDWDHYRDISSEELELVRKLRDVFLPFFPK